MKTIAIANQKEKNKRKRYGVILAVIGYIIFFSCMEGWGADWRSYGWSDYGELFYDASNITHLSKNLIRIWEKTVLSEKGRELLIKDGVKYYANANHNIALYEINCADKMFRVLSTTTYSNEGGIVRDWSGVGAWIYIIPDSVLEALSQKVCK